MRTCSESRSKYKRNGKSTLAIKSNWNLKKQAKAAASKAQFSSQILIRIYLEISCFKCNSRFLVEFSRKWSETRLCAHAQSYLTRKTNNPDWIYFKLFWWKWNPWIVLQREKFNFNNSVIRLSRRYSRRHKMLYTIKNRALYICVFYLLAILVLHCLKMWNPWVSDYVANGT